MSRMKKLVSIIFLFVFYCVFASPAHAEDIITSGKLITVDIGSQTLRAWEGGQIKHETKVSTGMALTKTVKGSFKIRTKVPMQDMRGPSPYKQY